MCGIVGYVGGQEAAGLLTEGLRRLEYRGYDSAGLAVVGRGSVRVVRSVGKLENLEAMLTGAPPAGSVGIGHTRWATHGRPSLANAHPQTDCGGTLAVVHNGIIENHAALRRLLTAAGHRFGSETDTEVLAHLIEEKLDGLSAAEAPENARALVDATRRALSEVLGAYALAVVWSQSPDVIVAAKRDSPLVVGLGDGETFVASDVPAFLGRTRSVLFLEDGELAALGPREREFFAPDGGQIEKRAVTVPWDDAMARKGGHRHFMLKEIYEQPRACQDTLRGRLSPLGGGLLERDSGLPEAVLRDARRIHMVACGTALHACMVARYWLERMARVPVSTEIASEFRYRETPLGPGDLVVAVSQSGETADTLAAVRLARERGADVVAVCNTVGAAIPRASNHCLYTRCGPEVGVASTKAYTGQLTALAVLALHTALARGTIGAADAGAFADELGRLPELIGAALTLEPRVREAAEVFGGAANFVFIGRHVNYPVALEGALKLKELSYIHAEGFAAGELKHGPIALIDEGMPVVAIATRSQLFEKVAVNFEEVKARGARLIALTTAGDAGLEGAELSLGLPPTAPLLAPFVNTVPLQLLAYHIADRRGCDIDRPRNLAKSVTVE